MEDLHNNLIISKKLLPTTEFLTNEEFGAMFRLVLKKAEAGDDFKIQHKDSFIEHVADMTWRVVEGYATVYKTVYK